MNVIFGASGHAREIAYFLGNARLWPTLAGAADAPLAYFVDATAGPALPAAPVIAESDFEQLLATAPEPVRAYIAIGNAAVRRAILRRFSGFASLTFPTLLDKSVTGDFARISLGAGNILFPMVVLTTDIRIGQHNHFNLGTSISHDCVMGDYNTLSPGVRIAGNVTIGNRNFFGTGASVIDNITVGDDIIIGAGAVVVSNLTAPGTYVGVPAKRLK